MLIFMSVPLTPEHFARLTIIFDILFYPVTILFYPVTILFYRKLLKFDLNEVDV